MVTASEKEIRNLRNPLKMRWVSTHFTFEYYIETLLYYVIRSLHLHLCQLSHKCKLPHHHSIMYGWSRIDSVFEKIILSERMWFGRRCFLFCGFIYLLLFIMICLSWVPSAMFVLWSNRRNEKIRILLQMLMKVRKSGRDWEFLLKCLASSVELSSLEEVWAFF